MSVAATAPGGVRLRHPFFKSGVLTIEHRGRPLATPYPCPMCGKEHVVKTYHLTFDSLGITIVSVKVFERLNEIGYLAGFQMFGEGGVLEYVDDVRKPPAQTLSFSAGPQTTRIERHRIGDNEADDDSPTASAPTETPMPHLFKGVTG